MSKTDKTTPAWVRHARDGMPRHDHARRNCAEDSVPAARRRAAGPPRGHHVDHCPSFAWIVVDCETAHCYTATRTAWIGNLLAAPACTAVHRRRVPTGVPCAVCTAAAADWDVCENRIEFGSYLRGLSLYGAVAPGWYVRHRATKPRRNAGKQAARRALREWNAGYRPDDDEHPDLEDGWEPALETKNVAGWWW